MERKLYPSQDYIKQILTYEPSTGVFRWNKYRNQYARKNEIAGRVADHGYVRIGFNKTRYYAHVLAWIYMEGYCPEGLVDHEDRNRSNNKWSNLRHISSSCNVKNRGMSSCNTSGVTGVNRPKAEGRWRTEILSKEHGKYYCSHATFNKAVLDRYRMEQKWEFYKCKSDSSAYKYLKEKNLL